MEVSVGKLSDFAGKNMVAVVSGDYDLLITRDSTGALCAMVDRCSHADVKLSEGDWETGIVECCAHGAKFDAKTGRALCMPAVSPVRTFPLRIANEEVFVTLPD